MNAITAPGPGHFVLDHRADYIELWQVDGDEPELTDAALLVQCGDERRADTADQQHQDDDHANHDVAGRL